MSGFDQFKNLALKGLGAAAHMVPGGSSIASLAGGLAFATHKPNWKKATWTFVALTVIMILGAVISGAVKNNTALAWTASLAAVCGVTAICCGIYTATLMDNMLDNFGVTASDKGNFTYNLAKIAL